MKELFIVASLLMSTSLLGQNPKEAITFSKESDVKTLIKLCSEKTQSGNLIEAKDYAEKLLSKDKENSNYNYRLGFITLLLNQDYNGAIPYLEKAIKDIDANFDMYSSTEKSAPTDAYYHLGVCYHLKGELEKAKSMYAIYQELSRSESNLIELAELKYKQCEVAIELLNTPTKVELKNLGETVNSVYADYSLVTSLDGKEIYYTSRRPWEKGISEKYKDSSINQYPEDVYKSSLLEDSTWSNGKRLAFCDARINNASVSSSPSDQSIYLYSDSIGSGDIQVANYYSNELKTIESIQIDSFNTPYWETHCVRSYDGNLMIFSSDRPGGFGGRDLYVIKRNVDGNWSKPVNLGSEINSKYDEDSPFLNSGSTELYYASNGEKSIGGFDVFRSEINMNGNYLPGKNLGYPINSTGDDIFFTQSIDGAHRYISSFRPEGFGEKDIYEILDDSVEIITFSGVFKTLNNEPLPAEYAINVVFTCMDCSDKSYDKVLFPNLKDGGFNTTLSPCKTYKVEINNLSDKKTMFTEIIITNCENREEKIYREYILDVPNREISVPVKEIEEVTVVEFKNIEFIKYFGYNKNKLYVKMGALNVFVKQVEDQLKNGRKNITINVYSSASHVPTKTYDTNEKLTAIRAENMKYDLQTYFESIPEFKDRVNVVIVSAIVDGPEYKNDAYKKGKYRPYQFVGLKTE